MEDHDDTRAGDPDRFAATGSSTSSRLRDAMRKARFAQTVRTDVIVGLRETEIARLEVLADALAPVFGEIPPEAEQFECSLLPGATPRLWIDMLAFVDMGRDKRTYRFVSESRAGRQVMLETTNVSDMADKVMEYIAHRLVERERTLASVPRVLRDESFAEHAATPSTIDERALPTPTTAPRRTAQWGAGLQIGLAYLAGLATGAGGIVLVALYLTD